MMVEAWEEEGREGEEGGEGEKKMRG